MSAGYLELGVGLLDLLANCFEALGRHHEGLLSRNHLFRILVDRKVIFDLVFFFFEILLKLFVVVCPQRYNDSGFSFVLVARTVNTVEVTFFHVDY